MGHLSLRGGTIQINSPSHTEFSETLIHIPHDRIELTVFHSIQIIVLLKSASITIEVYQHIVKRMHPKGLIHLENLFNSIYIVNQGIHEMN